MKRWDAESTCVSVFAPQLEKWRNWKCFDSQLPVNHMQVHIFRGPGRVFGFTADATGGNLPQKHAPWTAFKSVELRKGQDTPGVNAGDCLADIEVHGVHVTDAHARITEEAIR